MRRRILTPFVLIAALAAPPGLAAGSTLDDMDLRSNVEATIRGTAATANLHLKIEVLAGVAILSGRVRNLATADQVVDLAAKVRGIGEVDRRGLILENEGIPDDAVAKAVARSLSDVPKFASSALTVEVHAGIVTVTGTIQSGTFRKDLRDLVGTIDGVVDLVDRLVTPETPDDVIQRVLDQFFAPRAIPRFPGSVTARVAGGAVTLAGRVPRLFDKHAAEAHAYAINGVRSVDNRLELSGTSAVKLVNP